MFKEHIGKVKNIQWFDDDSGFASTATDGLALLWRLNPDSLALLSDKRDGEVEKNPYIRFESKQSKINDIALKPESKSLFYLVTEDSLIKEVDNGFEKIRFESPVTYS